MNTIVEILMRRDHETEESAIALYEQTKLEIIDTLASGGKYDDIEDILYGNLGLEMDYIFEFI